jgi:hypothetical protein
MILGDGELASVTIASGTIGFHRVARTFALADGSSGCIQYCRSFNSCDVYDLKFAIGNAFTGIPRFGAAKGTEQSEWADGKVFGDLCHIETMTHSGC